MHLPRALSVASFLIPALLFSSPLPSLTHAAETCAPASTSAVCIDPPRSWTFRAFLSPLLAIYRIFRAFLSPLLVIYRIFRAFLSPRVLFIYWWPGRLAFTAAAVAVFFLVRSCSPRIHHQTLLRRFRHQPQSANRRQCHYKVRTKIVKPMGMLLFKDKGGMGAVQVTCWNNEAALKRIASKQCSLNWLWWYERGYRGFRDSVDVAHGVVSLGATSLAGAASVGVRYGCWTKRAQKFQIAFEGHAANEKMIDNAFTVKQKNDEPQFKNVCSYCELLKSSTGAGKGSTSKRTAARVLTDMDKVNGEVEEVASEVEELTEVVEEFGESVGEFVGNAGEIAHNVGGIAEAFGNLLEIVV